MGFKEDIGRRIERKRAEIAELEAQVGTARTYLQALEDMYKLASRDAQGGGVSASTDSPRATPSFRAGSMTGQAYDALRAAGKAMHVNDLLPAIGRTVNRQERSAISGTLAAYVRKGDVFTRPAPNTFGLVEFGEQPGKQLEIQPLPADFGSL